MSSVERHDAAELSYAVFVERFLARNQPVILTSAVQGMACFDEGLAGIEQRFGDVQVPVVGDAALLAAPMTSIFLHERNQLKTYCAASGDYGTQRQQQMTVHAFLQQQQNSSAAAGSLYLKDWHFQRETKLIGSASYKPPVQFCDDWLNAYCDVEGSSDYRFVYIGGARTHTPLHHDVLCSYSWSANISGSKRWLSAQPPSVVTACSASKYYWIKTHKLLDRTGCELAADITPGMYDAIEYPLLASASRYEVLQAPGEALFVPSGWHHQ
eukprot:7697-Heterococcus_DN1.PRE.1